ncbi:phosphoribosylformylglycinamidine synthase subunit PurQ [Membranicola marinus]|uniref:Phosphoribosylformylglycinamidine synthase subunit PurQ n=1 Tax=Membranihabitans marinus TaxID=1227546 RepID=A0A953LEE8_9BACT|nr:phosphoribosylformylglycinamidine synthase subunit PurQ [Membranihabitans marinus]MBY5959879.1 phosphoribosylformylglycinamidine synthase subunit PurQ [Membranihabitans marinus]
MKFGVVVFPGSNCDDDMVYVLEELCGGQVEKVWHKKYSLEGFGPEDCIILPGGFSYGDYLRSGAIARISHIMEAVIKHANQGGYVFGICNGFQILCEAGLLPGVLLANENQKYISRNVHLRTETTNRLLTHSLQQGQVLTMPVAHGDGRYYCDENTLADLKANDQILFRYCSENGTVDDTTNLNGSVDRIAGICNEAGNVFGMMPHPERASEAIVGLEDGRILFENLFKIPMEAV